MRPPACNQLLESLPASDRDALTYESQVVTLRAGETLVDPGREITDAYFPLDCAISLLVVPPYQPEIATALIGREGIVGLSLILGAHSAALRAVVQCSGTAWRVGAGAFAQRLRSSAALRGRMNRYAHVRFLQMAQGASCTGFHLLEGRLARWLLMSRDRTGRNEHDLTHEFLARMLGVRRAGVTLAANALRDRRLTDYSRGHLVLLDVRGLEATACSCYRAEKRIYVRGMR
jgi:CRP-like cAMP-binding protein